MARTDGGGTRRRSPAAALEAGREHINGDNASPADGKTSTDQADAGAQPGDKAGEEGRREFTIPEDRRAQLARARDLDKEEDAGGIHEDAFWTQICADLDANSATVQPADDVLESGIFTAWPLEEGEAPFNPATNEADHTAALDRFEQIVAGAELSLPTLKGDLRDCMLDVFRNRHKPWGALSPREQRDVAAAIDYAVEVGIRKAVRVIAAEGRPGITATLEKYADKGGEITASIKIVAAGDETVLALHRASGKAVLIVAADAGEYLGQRREVDIDREDPELAFDAGSDADRVPPPPDNSDLADAGDKVVDDDALYHQAVELVRKENNASVSWLQRKMEIGYNAATLIIARMEAEGIVSAPDVTTKRTVLPADPGDSGERGEETKPRAPAAAEAE